MKNKFLKLFSVLMVFVFLLTLCGCKKEEKPEDIINSKPDYATLLHETKAYNIYGDIDFEKQETSENENKTITFKIDADIDTNVTDTSKQHSHGFIKYSYDKENWEILTEIRSSDSLLGWNAISLCSFVYGSDKAKQIRENMQSATVKRDLAYYNADIYDDQKNDEETNESISEDTISSTDYSVITNFKEIINEAFPKLSLTELVKNKVITVSKGEGNAVTFIVDDKSITKFVQDYIKELCPDYANEPSEENLEKAVDILSETISPIIDKKDLPEGNTIKQTILSVFKPIVSDCFSTEQHGPFYSLTNESLENCTLTITRTIAEDGTYTFDIKGTLLYKEATYKITGSIDITSIPQFDDVELSGYSSLSEYKNASMVLTTVPTPSDTPSDEIQNSDELDQKRLELMHYVLANKDKLSEEDIQKLFDDLYGG